MIFSEDYQWKALSGFPRGFFALIDGVLYVIPMLENGLMDSPKLHCIYIVFTKEGAAAE